MKNPMQVETVIVGAGQCGLAAGHYLAKANQSCVILDEHDRVGDGWRRRYDSLRLYTPTDLNCLPGLGFAADGERFPTGRQMGDYLERYATQLALPVVSGARVESARPAGDGDSGFVVTAGGRSYEASNLVVATGSQQVPRLPAFAAQVDPDIRQFHSDDYRNPSQLAAGDVLIVGASHSGADLAMECAAAGHRTWLCGPDNGQLPTALEGGVTRALQPLLWFMASHVLTLRTPMGRKMQDEVRNSGGPLLRYRRQDLEDAGVRRIENRVAGVQEGQPQLDDGTTLRPATVIWCTGYTRDYSWLSVPYPVDGGWPKQERGVVAEVPGLYFLGLLFQYAFSSMLVGGAARDARHVVNHITKASATSDRVAVAAQQS